MHSAEVPIPADGFAGHDCPLLLLACRTALAMHAANFTEVPPCSVAAFHSITNFNFEL
jgi:hypothetical protein